MDMSIENRLTEAAKEAVKHTYSPYSHFGVGAALWAGGRIYTGTNIENASYSMTICAERVAVFYAIFSGERDLQAICVYHNGEQLPYPCGACLQVLSEFCSDMDVLLISDKEKKKCKLSDLLPTGFKLKQ